MRVAASLSVVAVLLGVAPAIEAQALDGPPAAVGQDTVPQMAGPSAQELEDRQRPVSPMGAFWRSFLIPGWGQAKLNRKLTGGIFIAVEGISLGMIVKTSHQLNHLERINDPLADSKQQQREDWITILVFNHLMSGLEGFVSAHLWNFPDDLKIQGVPGAYGAQVTVPIRLP